MRHVLAVVAALTLVGVGSLAQAGAFGGPRFQHQWINPNSTDRYQINFSQGDFAQVRVHSYGSTMVEVTVYDGFGNVIATSNDRSGDAVVTWYVTVGGTFTIRVHNPAGISNDYEITTN